MNLRLLGLLACVSAVSACGEDPCGGASGGRGVTGSPALVDFSYLYQLDGDPWTAVFSAEFLDPDGDLGQGDAEFFLNGGSPTSLSLSEFFIQSGLGIAATEGVIGIPLRFTELTRSANILLGLKLVDGSLNRSNCVGLDLKFKVESVP